MKFNKRTPGQDIIDKDIAQIIAQCDKLFERLAGKTLLITGPNGLLASYLVDTVAKLNESYLSKPCRVIGLHRSPIAKGDRLGHLLGRNDICLIRHNAIESFSINEPVNFIIHAAGDSAPKSFLVDPLGTIDINVKGIRWLLDLCTRNPVESIMYFSSGEIYGDPDSQHIPTPETYNGNTSIFSSRACYIEAKRLSETICYIYHKNFNVPVKIVRPMLVYGPGLRYDDARVMAEFIRHGINKEPITMLDSGDAMRAYCYILDATVVFWKILFSDYNGEPFNIGNDSEEVTIRQLAELVHEICGIVSPVRVIAQEKQEFVKGAPRRVCPELTRIRKLFNYSPQVTLKEGLRRTIEWNRGFS